jgi:hypothetical protein
LILTSSAGSQGPGGRGGPGGARGQGGNYGDPKPVSCSSLPGPLRAESGRMGTDGHDGEPGNQGKEGLIRAIGSR